MELDKAVVYHQDTNGNKGFFGWNEHRQAEMSPDAFTHSLHYPKGVFEGIRAVWGKNPEGLHLITFQAHIERLKKSSEYMGLMDVDVEETMGATNELIRRNVQSGFLDPELGCYIRHLVYSDKKYAEGERIPGLGVYSGGHTRTMTVTLFPWSAYLEGTKVRVFEQGISSPLRKHKTCANYGFGGLAKDTAVEAGFDEALITDTSPQRNVLEGGGENVSLALDDRIITPGLDQDILPGTKRGVLIKMLGNYGIPVDERRIPLDEFMEGEGALFTGTAAGVVPIESVFDPVTDREKVFDPEAEVCGIKLTHLAEEYERAITGQTVDPTNVELQASIRTFVPL